MKEVVAPEEAQMGATEPGALTSHSSAFLPACLLEHILEKQVFVTFDRFLSI